MYVCIIYSCGSHSAQKLQNSRPTSYSGLHSLGKVYHRSTNKLVLYSPHHVLIQDFCVVFVCATFAYMYVCNQEHGKSCL